MHKSATKCNETLGKWCKNKHGASKIMDTLETYQTTGQTIDPTPQDVIRECSLSGARARFGISSEVGG
jgi:hypothetical protein